MKTILMNAKNLQTVHKQATPCVMALGYFDGVHLGHQQVINEAREEANNRGLPLAVMSFRPHPINVLSGGKRLVPHLTTFSEKQTILAELGVDLFYLVEFTPDFAKLLPKQFVQDYLVNLKVVHAVAGFDFSYGAKGAAKLNQIVDDSDHKITVTKVECHDYKGEKISSTAIRQRLSSANVHEIYHFLGKDYTVKAMWNGRRFVQLEKKMLPASGIYEVELEFIDHYLKAFILVHTSGHIKLLEPNVDLMKGSTIIHWLKNVKSPLASLTTS
ncbi:adenylyltransferase/cytidyltransferase family protein [Oceanobacillus senegalensis]|uniref:adenylyltransferase/cytidyltransferase family protein n=1 Tax=Oceanobacillus senegalensis TaxID=1936063 RepID=UPI000A3057B0|nr:adenylyltransferase/cytidyltransferase family protein [Oceanobacillus senegalensis]